MGGQRTERVRGGTLWRAEHWAQVRVNSARGERAPFGVLAYVHASLPVATGWHRLEKSRARTEKGQRSGRGRASHRPLSWSGARLPQEQAHRHPDRPSCAPGFVGACSMLQLPFKRLTPRHGGEVGQSKRRGFPGLIVKLGGPNGASKPLSSISKTRETGTWV